MREQADHSRIIEMKRENSQNQGLKDCYCNVSDMCLLGVCPILRSAVQLSQRMRPKMSQRDDV